jgi:DNA-binding SARP family transcriptional activator
MERERLAQLLLQTIHRALQGCRQMNDWAGVIAFARRGLRYDPLQESLYYAMMEAHALRGERDQALRQYQELCKNLDRELGVTPLPETITLRNAIAHGDLLPMADPTAVTKWWPHPQDFATLPIGLSGRALLNLPNAAIV